MFKASIFSLSIILILISCNKTTFWTTNTNTFTPESFTQEELQITDSTFTEYNHSFNGCLIEKTGFSTTRNAQTIGDTIFVYDIGQSYYDTLHQNLQVNIVEAYYKKGKKLYPIYPFFPHSYASFIRENKPFDSTGIKTFSVNWVNWKGKTAYIDFNSGYHKRGKYRELRNVLKNNISSGDTIIWHYILQKELINDSTIHQPYKKPDHIGPLR